MTRSIAFMAALLGTITACSAADEGDPKRVVATVDNDRITEGEVRVRLILDQAADSESSEIRHEVIEDLIDRSLLRRFLVRKGIKVADDLVGEQWQRLEAAASAKKLNLAAELDRIGYPESAIKDDLWLPIAWTMYVRRETTDAQLKDFFESHRARFDGTTRHVRHLILKAPVEADPAARKAAAEKIKAIRDSIAARKSTFSDAARKSSESPSAASGGDLGFVHFHGDLPPNVAEAAFALKLHEVSEPVASPYGWHLVTVEEDLPGDLSLDDVRPDVFAALEQSQWKSTAAELRAKAKIKIMETAKKP